MDGIRYTITITCPGPLVWYETNMVPVGAVLECQMCGYFVTTGNFHDKMHEHTPLFSDSSGMMR